MRISDWSSDVCSSDLPAIRALVQDLNIKRKAAYTASAQSTGSTVEQFAFTSGCTLIAKTKPGEKSQTPGGAWKTRDASPPARATPCPYNPQPNNAATRPTICRRSPQHAPPFVPFLAVHAQYP